MVMRHLPLILNDELEQIAHSSNHRKRRERPHDGEKDAGVCVVLADQVGRVPQLEKSCRNCQQNYHSDELRRLHLCFSFKFRLFIGYPSLRIRVSQSVLVAHYRILILICQVRLSALKNCQFPYFPVF